MAKYTNNRTGQAFTSQIAPLDNVRPPTSVGRSPPPEGLVTLHLPSPWTCSRTSISGLASKDARGRSAAKAKAARSTYDPTDVTSTEAEIRRITSKGEAARSQRTVTFGRCKAARKS